MNKQNRLLKVFLCHTSSDKPKVQRLYSQLANDGIDAWLDKEKLIPGQNWQMEIPKAVRNSDVVIVCLSSQSVSKDGFVQKEIKFALDAADEKPEGTIFIIPARLENCNVPERISQFHWVDLFAEDGYKRLLQALDIRAKTLGVEIKPVANNTNFHTSQVDAPKTSPRHSEKIPRSSKKPQPKTKVQNKPENIRPIKNTDSVILERINELENQKKIFKESIPSSSLIGISTVAFVIISFLLYIVDNAMNINFSVLSTKIYFLFSSLGLTAILYMIIYNNGKRKDKSKLNRINKEIEELKNKPRS